MHIVQPAMVVVMGEPALDFLNSLEFPLSKPVAYRPGEIQPMDALHRGAARCPTSTPR